MNRIYDDRGFVLRNWASTAILVMAVVWGAVEVARAATGVSDETGYLFGAEFIAAAAYGAYRLIADLRDTIIRLEVDSGSGQSVATLWQPWGLRRLSAPLSELKGWRLYITMRSKMQRNYLLRVNHPAHPRPLHIELMPGKTDLAGLRGLASEAIDEFEATVGKRKSG